MKEFRSDGCSGFLSFNWRLIFRKPPPWEGCCTVHDLAYYHGGPLHLRLEADRRLRECVKANGHPVWAWLMFVAVRIGGVYWIPFLSLRQVDGKWKLEFDGVRWGYGYPYPQYQARR